MILCLQELEFLFNPIQGLRDSEFKGLACSLVRRLQVTSEGDQGRRCEGKVVKQKSQRREKRMGHKQKIKLEAVGKRGPKLEPSIQFREGESRPSQGSNFIRSSEASLLPAWTVPARRSGVTLPRGGYEGPGQTITIQPALPQTVLERPRDRRNIANSLSAPSSRVTGPQ